MSAPKYKIVPVEPTTDMTSDGASAIRVAPIPAITPIWKAMVAASPGPTEEMVEKVGHRICARRNGDCPCANLKAKGSAHRTCPAAKEDARAALAAIMEG